MSPGPRVSPTRRPPTYALYQTPLHQTTVHRTTVYRSVVYKTAVYQLPNGQRGTLSGAGGLGSLTKEALGGSFLWFVRSVRSY